MLKLSNSRVIEEDYWALREALLSYQESLIKYINRQTQLCLETAGFESQFEAFALLVQSSS